MPKNHKNIQDKSNLVEDGESSTAPSTSSPEKTLSILSNQDLVITSKDLGGNEHMLPIIQWNRYLETEKMWFFNQWKTTINKGNYNDFDFLKLLGQGHFAKVFLVFKKDSKRYYAAKVVSGKRIRRKKKFMAYLENEKLILHSIRFTFTSRLEYFIQDHVNNLYFIIPLAIGGSLSNYMKEHGKMKEDNAIFYSAQILLALEYLHYMNLIYRDLKPDNILLDHLGFLKLTDFGLCKLLQQQGRTYTNCGTTEYLAPEIITGNGYNLAVDWWSFGIVIYELCSGKTPFYADNRPEILKKITIGNYKCPEYFSGLLQSLLLNLLQIDDNKRFGNMKRGVGDIKNHAWYKNIGWLALVNRQMDPPLIPHVELIVSEQLESLNLNDWDDY